MSNLLDDLKKLVSKHDENSRSDCSTLSELECRHEICVSIADHDGLPIWARWEVSGVSYAFRKDGKIVEGYISFFNILDAVIDRRIQRAKV